MILKLSTRTFETVLVVFITYSLIIQSINAAERLQEIILYTETNFTGKSRIFNGNNLDLRTDDIGRVAKSHCIIRGLWRIGGIFNNNPTLKFIENAHADGKSGHVCGTWNNNERSAQYKSIKYIGSPDLEVSAISLYAKTRFYSDEELYFEGSYLRLPAPITFSSFGFTGKDNWRIFKDPRGYGESICLEPNIDPIGDFTVTFNTNKTIEVGAISRRCNPLARENESTERPITKPSTQKPKNGSPGNHLQKYNNLIIPLTSSGYLYIRMNSRWITM